MIRINENYSKLAASYLFADIARRVGEYAAANPGKPVIRLGIGDVTEPLPPACVEALHAASDEMSRRATFKGYGPEQGYAFLREAVAQGDYAARGCRIEPDESSSRTARSATAATSRRSSRRTSALAIPDPVYPVYVDTNVMAGRTGAAPAGATRGSSTSIDPGERLRARGPRGAGGPCLPLLPEQPDGRRRHPGQLAAWVDYARRNKAVILFDSAYEAYIRDPAVPHSIYEIEGAREVAIEFRSFSKTAGFTGLRCAYAVVPKTLSAWDRAGRPQALHALWNRRHTTKFNGVSYPVQRAAAATYTAEGRGQTRALTDFYLGNARLIREAMGRLGLKCVGGDNAPYIWVNVGRDSWEFFDLLLDGGPGRLHAGRGLRPLRRGPRPDKRVQQPRERRGRARPDRRRAGPGLGQAFGGSSEATSCAREPTSEFRSAASRPKSDPSHSRAGAS